MYIIIQLIGGLGNQLFQIANAYQLSIKYKRQLFIYEKNGSNRGVYWNNILSYFEKNLITEKEFSEYKKKSKIYNWASRRFEYKEIILDPEHEYYCIEGYYQSYKYFDINLFEKLLNFDVNNNFEKVETDHIALHIRRTDYLNKNFHKPLSLDYYYNSLKQMISALKLDKDIKIYIFSDDLDWCKENFEYKNIVPNYVTLNGEIDELYMMTKFQNIIIANSSFSWWGACLNNQNNKKVIYCPKNWFNNGCHLKTKDLRPENWNIIDDDLIFHKEITLFDKKVFNVISLGSACCMIHNIHCNIYNDLGPLFRRPDNATNFFDWLITDFKSILFIFENLMFKDNAFLCENNFTFKDVNASPQQLKGGWSKVYKKVEFKDKNIGSMIYLHDVKKECVDIPNEFIEKYKRRFNRLYDKIKNHDTIYFMHCFDFQWLEPYFPLVSEIEKIFESCKLINPLCNVKLYFFIHPKYHNNAMFEEYKFIDNVELCFLKNKGFHTDWKANNLTFDEFL
uniref:Alpha-1,2-Fucosyltransferase n=1 Tax=Florenciella sp. virus SA2 TaxID=3240092 RepID=A0AB39JDI7_9VIRU